MGQVQFPSNSSTASRLVKHSLFGMAGTTSLHPTTPPPDKSSPSQHQEEPTITTPRLHKKVPRVKCKSNVVISAWNRSHNFPSMATSPLLQHREMKGPAPLRVEFFSDYARKKRRIEGSSSRRPEEQRPKTPPAPKISRLPTPDLSDPEEREFCGCCNKKYREDKAEQ